MLTEYKKYLTKFPNFLIVYFFDLIESDGSYNFRITRIDFGLINNPHYCPRLNSNIFYKHYVDIFKNLLITNHIK